MEIVILLILIAVLWAMRKTIRIWSNVSEKVSEATARSVLLNTAKTNIKTVKKAQAMLADPDVTLDLMEVDSWLFEGKRPATATQSKE